MPRTIAAIVAALTLAISTHAQSLFFQPPTYAGQGNVFVADFNQDGKPDLLTADGTLSLGNGDGTFRLGTPVSGTVLAVADFNGDGKPDVLEQGTGTLLVLLGNGDGTFRPAVSTPSGASLISIAVADLNGDGKADVVGVFNSMLIVYLGKGDGTLAPGISYNIGTVGGSLVLSLGDFNGDHKTDVAVSLAGGIAAGQEIVFLGNGDGTFQTPKTSAGILSPDFTLGYAAVGDLNGDGKADLAVSTFTASCGCPSQPTVFILLGNGDGTFQAPTPAFTGSGPLVAADLNGDGKVDLFLQADGPVGQVYLGNGDGTFSNPSSYFLIVSSGAGIAIGDFNLDGKLDVAGGNAILLGTGNGTFQGIPFGVVPSTPFATVTGTVTGKFDTRGAPGVAVLSNAAGSSNVYILSNDGKGVLSLAHTYALQVPPWGIVTADLNGDGNLDLMVFGTDPLSDTWNYSVLLGNGDGSFQSPVFYPQNVNGTDFYSIVVGDFSNDGKLDVATSISETNLAFLRGNGNGTFAAPVYLFDAGATYLVSGDFNGDGKLDIAIAGETGTGFLYGNGDGTFQPAVFPANLSSFSVAFSADLNNDGHADLVSAYQVALGKGDGTFTVLPMLSYAVDGVADLNGDGKADLFVTFYGTSSHAIQTGVLLGNGDGTFASLINVPQTGVLPSGVFIADMNGDGRPDILYPWQSAVNGVAVLLNNTAPGFGPDFALSAGSTSAVTPGQTATYTISVSPIGGFNQSVTLSCTGNPALTSCTVSPNSVSLNGTLSANVTITITTTAPSSGSAPPFAPVRPNPEPRLLLLGPSVVLILASLLVWCRRQRIRWAPLIAFTVLLWTAVMTTSCGGGSSPLGGGSPGTQVGTYAITVTGSSGSSSPTHNTSLTLIVK
jgi:hypothetical protein